MAADRVRFSVTQLMIIATMAMISPRFVELGHAQSVAATASDQPHEIQWVTINVEDTPLLAVLRLIASQAGLVPGFEHTIIPSTKRVSLHVRDVSASEAFEQALHGTGLRANVVGKGNVAIVRASNTIIAPGTIVGRVIDAKTKQPLRGVKIGLDGADRVTETADDGTYRVAGVHAGSHTCTIKLLGYAKIARTVTVPDNATVTVDVALESSATALEQVVVTGMVIPTELKAVPNAITVITAKDIEQRGITHIDQLFRGNVPGLFAENQGANALLDEVTMFSRGATALSFLSAGTSDTKGLTTFTNPIKTYVDGVELADARYLSQLDPKSIERIEILTGPQASTIYGSNAINGVMQIFTKRGSSNTPQLTLNLMSGIVQNNFSSALTPQHDHSAQLNGIEGRLSYNAGGSWNYMGPWTPAKQTTRTSGFGGARLEIPVVGGPATTDVTFRNNITQNHQRGTNQQTATGFRETGWYTNISSSGLDRPQMAILTGQTLGLTMNYVLGGWWSHELGIGRDASDAEQHYTARGYLSISDTTLLLTQTHGDRRSLRYTTTIRTPVATQAQLTVTAGADAWQNLTTTLNASPQTLTGALTGPIGVSRQPGHNTGGFVQTQLGIFDRVFFTYGLRAEWNPDFGADAEPNYAPRYGLAYAQDLGVATVKLRGSYGRSTRPPKPGLQAAISGAQSYSPSNWSALSQYYPNFDAVLGNPDLTPEHQQGGEGGLEVYFGTRGSFNVTRYNQIIDGLIGSVSVADSVQSLVPNPIISGLTCAQLIQFGLSSLCSSQDANGYGYIYQSQYLNVGSIRNQGWELQGSINTGPFTTKGTYSWTKSRVIGVTPKYRSYFAQLGIPEYRPGATFQYLPEHTWAIGVTYAHTQTTVALDMTGAGRARTLQDDFFFQNLDSRIRLPQDRLNVSTSNYVNFNRAYAIADLSATHELSGHRVEGVVRMKNVANRYTNNFNALYAALGRQVMAGLQCRF